MFGTNRTAEQKLQDITILVLAAFLLKFVGATIVDKGPRFLPPLFYATVTENFAVTSNGEVIKSRFIISEAGTKGLKLDEGTYFSLDGRGRVQYRVKVDPTGHINIVRIPRGP